MDIFSVKEALRLLRLIPLKDREVEVHSSPEVMSTVATFQ